MRDRGKVINKLALVLLSIVVLELVLIGDQVQPVKAIKKKIILKKLKKLLPLLAIIKPKKKIILLPIPIPMMKNQGHYQTQANRPHPMSEFGHEPPIQQMPMSMDPGQVLVSVPMGSNGSMVDVPMAMMMGMHPDVGFDQPSQPPPPPPPRNVSQPLLAPKRPSKTAHQHQHQQQPKQHQQQQQQHQQAQPLKKPPASPAQQLAPDWQSLQQHHVDVQPGFEEPSEGDSYYSSPWQARAPLLSSADDLARAPIRPHSHPSQPRPPPSQAPAHSQQFRQQPPPRPAPSPMNQWRPVPVAQQQLQQQPFHEVEALIPVGPPQLVPIYQAPNGALHMRRPSAPLLNQQPQQPQLQQLPLQAVRFEAPQPPPVTSKPSEELNAGQAEHEEANAGSAGQQPSVGSDPNAEVQTLGAGPRQADEPATGAEPSGNLKGSLPPATTSGQYNLASSKGKQQQQQLQLPLQRPLRTY